jgi:outer membrane protein assembly factor BamB
MCARRISAAVLAVLGAAGGVWGDEWPQFRGPGGTGVAAGPQFPLEWGADKSVAWKANLPGYGWSSPVVWGDKVFVTTAVTDGQSKPTGSNNWKAGGFGRPRAPSAVYRWKVFCLRAADGKVLWKQTAAEQKPGIPVNSSNTFATETPVTDGRCLFVYFGTIGRVFCYDFQGKQLWKQELGTFPMMFGHGPASSPALYGDRLFIQCDNEERSFLVALDTRTGKEVWRVRRDERSTWSTPFVWKNRARAEVVCCGNTVRAYDPGTGKVLWELGGLRGQHFATPVGDEERLYVGVANMSHNRPLVAVRAGAAGDLTLKGSQTANAGVAWAARHAGPPLASPLLYRGYLYILDQKTGTLGCYEATTGKAVYKERLGGARGFYASPWAHDGKVYCLDQDGTTYVLQAGPGFKLLRENRIDDQFWASPAAAGGSLILRGVNAVYCIRK